MEETLLPTVFEGSLSVLVVGFLLLRVERELRELRRAIEGLRLCQTCRFAPSGPI